MKKAVPGLIAGYTESSAYRCLENLRPSSIELYLVYCGREENEPQTRFGPTVRNNHVLHFITSGKGELFIGDKSWELKEGDIFYILPGVKTEYVADKEDPWSYMWIGYNGMRAEEYSEMAGFSEEEPVRASACCTEVCGLIERMLSAHSMQVSEEILREALLLQVFAVLIGEREDRNLLLRPDHANLDFVLQALDYITTHFDKNIKISTLAKSLGVSRSYLSSSFKQIVGCSPQTYVLNMRMERAGSLLRTTTLPINVISDAVGYPDQLAFSKIFKQYYGESPRDYRRNGEEVRLFGRKGESGRTNL